MAVTTSAPGPRRRGAARRPLVAAARGVVVALAVPGLVVGSVVVTATAYSEAYTAFMRLVLRTSPARPMSMRFIT